jgi:hypothetical protein
MGEGYPRGLELESIGRKRACCRAMRVMVVVALVGVSLVGSACTGSGGSDPAVEDPRAKLEALAAQWGSRPATITYRTTEREPGDPTSPHQCLRQMVGVGEVDVATGLRLCSGVGEIRLAWDPPERWRMDEVSPRRSVTRVSTSERLLLCTGEGMDMFACVGTERDGPFGSLVDPPGLNIDEIGTVTAEAERTIAGIRSECFGVEGGSTGAVHPVEWCYSPDGLLLFLSDTVEGGRVVSAEATEVSRGVADGDFVVPSR